MWWNNESTSHETVNPLLHSELPIEVSRSLSLGRYVQVSNTCGVPGQFEAHVIHREAWEFHEDSDCIVDTRIPHVGADEVLLASIDIPVGCAGSGMAVIFRLMALDTEERTTSEGS